MSSSDRRKRRDNYVDHVLPSPRTDTPDAISNFNLKEHVLKEASQIPCYWPKLDEARKAATMLAQPEVANGSYILRPSTNDSYFLVVSVRRLSDSNDGAVLHFPIVSRAISAGADNDPVVHYSITRCAPDNRKIYSLKDLISFLEQNELTGNNLPQSCQFQKSLRNPDIKFKPPLIRTTNVEDDEAELRHSQSEDDSLYKNLESLNITAQQLPKRASTISSHHAPPPSVQSKQPVPAPRRNVPPRITELQDDRTILRPPVLCACGIPVKFTKLSYGWTVHKSKIDGTAGLLYFKDARGRSAWAPPPKVDKACMTHNKFSAHKYLEYGNLNRKCFQKHIKHDTYSSESELGKYYRININNNS